METTLTPQDHEAEEGLLGSLLLDPDAIVEVIDQLHPDDFYHLAHQVIYRAVTELYRSNLPADGVTVTSFLRERGQLEAAGGAALVSALAGLVPNSTNVDSYAKAVERTSLRRKLLQASGQIAALAHNEPEVKVALERSEQLIAAISHQQQGDFADLRSLLDEYYEKLDRLHEQRGLLVGLSTGFAELDRMTGGLQKSDLIIVAARPALGKCLAAGTMIDDPETGERLTIEACIQRRLATVYGLSAEGKVRPTSVSDWVDNGVQPCYRVRTTTGRSVEVTGTHPFLTVDGWKPLSDLSVGSAIAIPRAVPVFGLDESWPLDMVRLLAYYIAEGGLTYSSPVFTNTDPVLIADFREIIDRHFPECYIRHYRLAYIVARSRRAHQGPRGAIMPANPVTEWLKELGLWGKLSKEKHFPSCVWKWSKRYLAEFLRALMSCDGSIYALSAYPDLPYIEFTVASPQLARDVHHALTRFGILAKYYETKQGAYRVQVTSPDAVRRYQKQIGWIGEKAQRFKGLTPVIAPRLSNRGHPPKETWELVCMAARKQGLSMVEIARRSGETTATGHLSGYNPHMGRSLPSYRLAAYAAVLHDPQLQMIASADLYWDTIAAIEPIGEQQVYDLTVPDGANFIAQDVLVHNSSLALSLAYNVARPRDPSQPERKKVAFFALEMSKEQLLQRLLSMETGIDQHRLRQGLIHDNEWGRIGDGMGQLAQMGIYIDDTAAISIMEMRGKARRLAAKHGLDLVIVDYLQLMQGHVGGRNENRVQEISEISRGLKVLARELNVPVLALSQLSRAVESRQSRVPQLSDLRESGSIEQDSDIVLFIYRDQVYNPDTERKNIADIIVAKHRNGPLGQFSLYFESSQTLFRNLDLHGQQP